MLSMVFVWKTGILTASSSASQLSQCVYVSVCVWWWTVGGCVCIGLGYSFQIFLLCQANFNEICKAQNVTFTLIIYTYISMCVCVCYLSTLQIEGTDSAKLSPVEAQRATLREALERAHPNSTAIKNDWECPTRRYQCQGSGHGNRIDMPIRLYWKRVIIDIRWISYR